MPNQNPNQTEQNDTGRLQNVVRHGAEKAGEKAKEAAQTLTHEIEQQPVKATLIALGVGAILGILFSRL